MDESIILEKRQCNITTALYCIKCSIIVELIVRERGVYLDYSLEEITMFCRFLFYS